MGTNYYHRTGCCSECGRFDETHIGKRSYGWTFSFHGTDEIRSWEDWQKKLLSGGQIYDEGDMELCYESFEEIVVSKIDERHNHAERFPGDDTWIDSSGHSFCDGEFS